MTYSPTKFEVATSNGLGGDTFTRNVTDGRTHGQTDGRTDGRRTDFDTKLIYPFFLKKKAGITTTKMAYDFSHLTYNNDVLNSVENEKVLGVHIDNNLTWSVHINFIAKKIS